MLAGPSPRLAAVEWRDLGEHRLRDLPRPERLYQVVAAGLRDTFATLRTASARRGNLPVQLTSFVGRAELLEARRLLAATRHLTLSGPGGTGKTRLAQRLAAESADDFPDGTWFVPLDSVDDPALVGSAIAQALTIEAGAEPPLDRVARELRDRRALLVLDNFEQVVDAAPVVTRLLQAAPQLKIIVTSRILLRTSGEQHFDVPPLSLPAGGPVTAVEASQSEAVRLFVDRATAIVPSFGLTEENATAVADIVTRLDGLPLAIELAAARVRLLPLEALRTRLDRRLAVLTGGARDLPARQQTLRGAIDWSYDLLEEPDRRLFERLGVFAGGASLTQAEEVCGPPAELGGEVLDGLGSLVEKSLLRSMAGADDEPRFALLPTIREYALERLESRAGVAAVRRRHSTAYLGVASVCAPRLTGAAAQQELDRLALDHDNLRAAMDWAVSSAEPEIAHRLGAALWRFWQVRGHLDEARDRLERVLAMPGAAGLPAAIRAPTLGAAGSVAYWRGDRPATWTYYRAALATARESGDRALIADAALNAGFEPVEPAGGGARERYGAGRGFAEEAMTLYRELGDQRGLANALWGLAVAELAAADRVGARTHFEESLALHRQLRQPFGEGWALHMLGLVDLVEGHLDSAEHRFREAIGIFRASGDLPAASLLLLDGALLAQRRGQEERFWTLAGASAAYSQQSGAGLASNIEDFVDVERPPRPDGPEQAAWWDVGAAMSVDAAFDYTLGGTEPAASGL